MYPFVPDKVSVPELNVKPPVPFIAPENVSFAALKVSVLEPKVTVPAPLKVLILAPDVVLAISNVPAFATPLDAAIDPLPLKANVPALIVVPPV